MELIGQKREKLGKKVNSLRNEKILPAVVFSKDMDSLPISINYNDFIKVFKASGETQIIDLNIDKTKYPVLVKDVQLHHINSQPLHVSFQKVNLKEEINANIPVEVINEEQNELIKGGEALILVLFDEITVTALPTDLPEKFIIDALKLVDMDATITIADLEYDREKVQITDIEEEEIVAKLDYAQMEEEEEEEIDEAEAIAGIEATEEKEESDQEETEKE